MKNKLLLKIGFWILVVILAESVMIGVSVLINYDDPDQTIWFGLLCLHMIAVTGTLFWIILNQLARLYRKLYNN